MSFIGLKLLILVGLIEISISVDPKPCKTPDQWEGSYYSYDAIKRVRILGKLSYDAVNKRERVLQTLVLPDRNQTFDLLYLFNEKTLVINDVTQNKCSKVNVDKPWKDFGVPKNAVYFGKNYYGSSTVKNAGLLVSTWKDEYQDSEGNHVFHVSTWTVNSCLPVLDNYVSQHYSLHCVYMDITPGIKDQSVFEPNESCEVEEEEEREEEEENEEEEEEELEEDEQEENEEY